MDKIGDPKLTLFSVMDDRETQQLLQEYSEASTNLEELSDKIAKKQLESVQSYIRESGIELTLGEILLNTDTGKTYVAIGKQDLAIY